MRKIIHASLVALCLTSGALAVNGAGLTLGGNFNERLQDAGLKALDAGRVEWIRGFLPATEFLDGPRKLATDPRLRFFHEARKSGRKTALTLKWDFKGTGTRVPEPGSSREAACFQWGLDVVKYGRPDMLLLVNEIFVDTMDLDMVPDSNGVIPMVRFLQRLAGHMHRAQPTSSDGIAPLPLGCGGFTKMETRAKRSAPATRALLPWLSNSPELSLVNFHMHGDDLDDFAEALGFMRSKIPGKPFVITEFSLVWRYKSNLQDPLGSTAKGKAFAKRYRFDPGTTTLDYLNQCSRHQVSEKQFNDFLRSRSWYLPAFLEESVSLMEKSGVRYAFYAYHQGPPNKHLLKPDATPWKLNPIFIDKFATSPDPDRPAANLDFSRSFLPNVSANP